MHYAKYVWPDIANAEWVWTRWRFPGAMAVGACAADGQVALDVGRIAAGGRGCWRDGLSVCMQWSPIRRCMASCGRCRNGCCAHWGRGGLRAARLCDLYRRCTYEYSFWRWRDQYRADRACAAACAAHLALLDLPGQVDFVKIDVEVQRLRRWRAWRLLEYDRPLLVVEVHTLGRKTGLCKCWEDCPSLRCGASPILCRAGCVVVATFLDCGRDRPRWEGERWQGTRSGQGWGGRMCWCCLVAAGRNGDVVCGWMGGVLFLTGLLLVAVGVGRRGSMARWTMQRGGEKTMTGDAAVENLLLEVSILRSENAILRAYCEVAPSSVWQPVGTGFVYRGGMKGELRVDVDTSAYQQRAAMFGARRNSQQHLPMPSCPTKRCDMT